MTGISLRLRAAQIIELKEFGGGGSDFGFGDEGDGFVSETFETEFENEEENNKQTGIPF